MEKNETCEIVQPELNGRQNSSDNTSSSDSEDESDEEGESENEINDNNNNNNKNKNIISNKNKAVIKNPKRVMFANVMDATDLVVSSQQNDVTNKDENHDSQDDQGKQINGYDKVLFSSCFYLISFFN